jgi:hypothetical protein
MKLKSLQDPNTAGGGSGDDQNVAPTKIISIEDLSPDTKYEVSIRQLINSPRTMEAFRRQGVQPEDLDPVTEDMIRRRIAERDKSKRTIPPVLIEMRLKHYEERRRDLFRLVREVSISRDPCGFITTFNLRRGKGSWMRPSMATSSSLEPAVAEVRNIKVRGRHLPLLPRCCLWMSSHHP